MVETVKKYKLHMELEREDIKLTIDDVVEAPFNLEDYIFKHDLEAYDIIKFALEEIKEWFT